MVEPSKKGTSLWSDAWRRLRKNKFAMGGLVIVVVVSIVSIFAPVIFEFQPDYGQPWLRANPPGFSHPAVPAEVRLDVGEKPTIPSTYPATVASVLADDGVVEFTVLESVTAEFRIRTYKGKVRDIRQLEGARSVKVIESAGGGSYLERIDAEGKVVGERLEIVKVERRKKLPPGIPEPPNRVLNVRLVKPRTAAPETIRAEIKDGVVQSITRDAKPIEQLRLQGLYVTKVTKDGEERRLKHHLGTDLAGRDVMARVFHGGRISLMVGAVATLVSVLVGVVYGAVAGYRSTAPMTVWGLISVLTAIVGAGFAISATDNIFWSIVAGAGVFTLTIVALGKIAPFLPKFLRYQLTTVGELMMRIVDIMYALPFMFLVILLMISYGRDLLTLFIALGLVQWLMMARIVRGQVLSLREKEFIEAAEMAGTGHLGIVFRHLIPNTLGVVIVYATLTVPAVILQESFLAFIGLNVAFQGRTIDSWGALVDQGRQSLTSGGGNWWILVFPSLAMAITLFSLNFLGDGLRDALDPKMKGKS